MGRCRNRLGRSLRATDRAFDSQALGAGALEFVITAQEREDRIMDLRSVVWRRCLWWDVELRRSGSLVWQNGLHFELQTRARPSFEPSTLGGFAIYAASAARFCSRSTTNASIAASSYRRRPALSRIVAR